jgi:periplasmic protein TonB
MIACPIGNSISIRSVVGAEKGDLAMFDKLVESTKSKQRGRSGRLFFLTGLIYATLLGTLVVWTILGFSPGLAEGVDFSRLTPLVPYTAPPPVSLQHSPQRNVQEVGFVPPSGRDEIPPPTQVLPVTRASTSGLVRVIGGPIGPGSDLMPSRFPGGSEIGAHVPPPPPRPTPTPEPTPEVKPTPRTPTKVSEGVTQGLAIRRVLPQYPAIARAARAAGPVQVQILISEEGRVLSAEVLGGHPLLRQAALDAARQWGFRPTLLSQVPVKVQGVLTFNFTLN